MSGLGLPIQMLNGLGCDCQNKPMAMGFGAVSDYDVIRIGGVDYSANQIVDKIITASKDVTVYRSLYNDTGKFNVKAGQPIGKVFSYLRADNAANPTGKIVLIFESAYNQDFYLKDDGAVSQSALKDQGTLNVKQETQLEQDAQKKEDDPVGYYLKKYGVPALLIIGGIVIVGGVAKTAVGAAISRRSAPALSGPKKRRSKKRKSKK
jgi:hypothetical protein